ncbi:restriction endonuclease subunit S, partial [Vibrio parahaemolyticus]
SDLGGIIGGGTPKSNEDSYWTDKGVKWLTPADLYGLKSKYIGSGKRDITKLGLEKSSAQLLPKGSVLFSSRAPIGYVAITSNELATNQGFKSVVPIFQELSEYIYYFLKRAGKFIDAEASGTTFKEVSGTVVSKVLTPLPPIDEQCRIVAKVDELMALCDQLEQQTEASIEAHQVLVTTLLDTLTNSADADELMQSWARISEHFDTLFTTEESIDQLKQTILQLAVMGKLVPQDPNDEPASELLKRIAEEKAQLVKEKKIKKQKALPPISEDEKPFELPSGWEWCRLLEVIDPERDISYGIIKLEAEPEIGGVPTLRCSDVKPGYID